MAVRWFRISFARNAFLRLLAAQNSRLEDLTIAEAVRAFVEFSSAHRPQHAELDVSECRWNAASAQLVFTRRMRRHDHPEVTLALALKIDNAVVTQRSLT